MGIMTETGSKRKVLIICLTRRGGLLHFNDCLTRELRTFCELKVISVENAEHIDQYRYDAEIDLTLNTGSGAKGTLSHLLNLKTWRFFSKVIDSFKPEVIHITSAQEWNPFLGVYFRSIKRIPLIYTLHDVIPHEGMPLYTRITEKLFRHQPDGFVVLTAKGKEILVSEGIRSDSILVVPHGTYDFFTEYTDPLIKPRLEILFFGRIEPYKGIEILLKAAQNTLDRHPNWTLHIAGGGSLEPYRKYLDRPQIRVSNRFLSNEEVAAAMHTASIVALPYLTATQSGVIPIAFSFRKPVIATNVGGIPDVIKNLETGLLVPPNSISALDYALEKLIGDPALRRQLGENGWKYQKEELGWRSIARKHADFYESFVKQRTTP